MGSACCVAARDRTITNGPSSEALHQNVRHSPPWSVRWDNRGRVAGEDMSASWFSDGGNRNDGLDVKSATTIGTTCASEAGSPLNNSQTLAWQKSPVSDGNTGIWSLPPGALAISSNLLDRTSRNSSEVKESIESPVVSYSSPAKLSPSACSVSSFSATPLSSRSHLLPTKSIPSRRARRSPGHQLLRQVSDSRIAGLKSPTSSICTEASSLVLPSWTNESTMGSNGGSSDNWSIPPFSESVAASCMERWSFDGEALIFNHEKISRSSGGISVSSPNQTCGVCSKLLSEKSLWGPQKILATNELTVVAVLICGHVYHVECLENMTTDISNYDPACPVCTYGKKQVQKLSEKALKAEAELEWKARNNRRSRNRVIDSDVDCDLFVFDRQKSSGHEDRSLMMARGPGTKNSLKPFLKRHFSLGSKGIRFPSENQSTRKRGFFWTKSSKE